MSSGRKGRGRRKIEMKKMSNEIHLQATFSKRRSGLFKKASELCTLSGANVALIVFSPGEKVFSFGHPNVDTVIDRYLSLVPPQNNSTMLSIETNSNANVHELNVQLTMLNNALDLEKKERDQLNRMLKMNQDQYWWACPINVMNNYELEIFKKVLEDMKILVAQQAQHAQMFETQFFQNPMLKPHLFPHLYGFNNMGGQGGYGFF
ncbi:agamous MADS-box protein AGL62 [Trifolium repens]|nr:agamous MADS-box protein AGL62 [Trifolium repens]